MKILFYSLHSAIWVHAFPEALVAEALREQGHKVSYVSCGGQLQLGCTAMSVYGVDSRSSEEARREVCARCTDYARLLRRELSLSQGGELAAFVTDADRREIEALMEQVTRENFLGFKCRGISVGRVASYEFLLATKKSSLEELQDAEWDQYRVALRNTLYSLFGGGRMLDKEQPDALVVYNSLYSVNNVLCRLADARGIRRYMLHAGLNLGHRLETMICSKGDIFDLLSEAKGYWRAHRDEPVRADAAAATTDHFIELLKGRSPFAYSAAKTGATAGIRARFGIRPEQKILCATMSSYDERFAAEIIGSLGQVEGLLFPYQVDWIKALVGHVAQRPDLFLIIRVHPREFPNKRDAVKSAHAALLEGTFRELPANAAVNWPADNLSLYDLAEHTDVFLNAWSSVGKEMSLLGLPVVAYSEDYLLYPADLNYVGQDRDAYFSAIERALVDGWQYENLRRAYRWYQIEFSDMSLDLSDSFRAPEEWVSLPRRALRKLRRAIDPLYRQRADCRARARPLAAGPGFAAILEDKRNSVLDLRRGQPVADAGEERQVLRHEMARLAQALFGGQDASRASPLRRRIESFVRGENEPAGDLRLSAVGEVK